MEETIFPAPAVARELELGFVEARLHTDGQDNIERILELQRELAGVQATPYYLIVDAETGEKLRVLERPTTEEGFRAFLTGE